MTNLLTLALATAVLVSVPGPNVALIVANSLRNGTHHGLITVFGTTLGAAVQLVLVVAGMTAIVEYAAAALTWIKWAGVLYLILLGIYTYRQPTTDLQSVDARSVVFWRGCMIAAINPKTLMFNAAFLPQFVGIEATWFDVGLVGLVFLSVIFLGDVLWAVFASSARRLFHRASHWQNRVAGGILVAAGVGLALSRRVS